MEEPCHEEHSGKQVNDVKIARSPKHYCSKFTARSVIAKVQFTQVLD